MRTPISLVWAVLPLCLASCASTGGGGFFNVGLVRDEPWTLPEGAFPTQRLYRVRYQGPEGQIGFKLTLYLHGETEFRMRAADGLGRKVWDLAVDAEDRALWLDHRSEEYCRAVAASRLALVPLAEMPLMALPKLLLGRMPSSPASDLRRSEAQVSFRDARGRQWSGGLRDGNLEWWSRMEGGEVVTWWRREADGDIFIDPRSSQQLRWREVVREPLNQPPKRLEVPPRYRERICTDADARRSAVQG